MILRPSKLWRITRLFADPPAGADGGNSGGDAGSSATPPAGADGGGGNASDADIMEFTPPDLGAGLAAITGKTEDPVKPAEGAKPPVKPVDPPAKPAGKSAGEPPAAQLRQELEKVKGELANARATMEKGDPRLADLQKEVEDRKAEIVNIAKERDEKLKEYETRLAIADPRVTAKLKDLDSNFDRTANQFFTRVPELNQAGLNQLVAEYAKLPFGKPEYREARAEFEKKANTLIGGSDEADHRKLGSTLEMVEKTFDFLNERRTVDQDIRTNAHKLRSDAESADYSKSLDFVKTNLAKAKTMPEGLDKSDPFHPKVMLDVFQNSLPDKGAALEAGIDDFIQLALVGPKPRPDADYAGMNPAQIAESRATERTQHETARAHSVDVMRNGLRALRLFPALVKEIQRLGELHKQNGSALPPDPTGGNGGDNSAAADDVANYQAPAIPGEF